MTGVTVLPKSQPLTRADLERMPDDGHRYELIDGALVVTPAPSPRHQLVSAGLFGVLRAACPSGLKVLYAPLEVALADDTVLQPDLLVARLEDFTDRDLPLPPLLAVEILSPSTRLIDLNLKRARYEQAGCPSYWVVDPEVLSITAWDLREGRYVEVARARGEQEFAVQRPFELSVLPHALIA